MKLPKDVAAFRKRWNFNATNFFTFTNPKAAKSAKLIDAPTAVLHLMPTVKTCPAAGTCKALCLNRAGNPAYLEGKLKARDRRTRSFYLDGKDFMQNLLIELVRFAQKHEFNGLRGCRLNGTSDIKWESVPVEVTAEISEYLFKNFETTIIPGTYRNIMQASKFLNVPVQFYDYTKRTDRDLDIARQDDYHLTVSYGSTQDIFAYAIANNLNIAAPFKGVKKSQALPQTVDCNGFTFPVVDGDITDWRVGDPSDRPHIVGLRLKRVPGMTPCQINSFCLA